MSSYPIKTHHQLPSLSRTHFANTYIKIQRLLHNLYHLRHQLPNYLTFTELISELACARFSGM